jgi:hypothetical protein
MTRGEAMQSGVASTSARAASRLALLVLSLGVCGILGEFALRIGAPQAPSWIAIYRRHPDLPFFALQPNSNVRIETGETSWSAITDADGFRVQQGAAGRDGRPIALVLGDSFTFGMGVEYEESFVSVVSEELDGRFHFANTAVPGYGPSQYRAILRHLLDTGMEPRLLLVGVFLGNDFQDCLWNKDVPVEDGVLGSEPGLRSIIKRNLHLYRLLSRAYHILLSDRGYIWQVGTELYSPEEWRSGGMQRAAPALRAEFEEIGLLVREREIPLLAAIIPTAAAVEAAAGRKLDGMRALDYALPARRLIEIFEELEITYVDFTLPFAATGAAANYFAHDRHLNQHGHRIAAREILQHMPPALCQPPLLRQ